MQEIEELKNKQKKNLMEIDFLKAQVAQKSVFKFKKLYFYILGKY